jgi:hypothetical protein
LFEKKKKSLKIVKKKKKRINVGLRKPERRKFPKNNNIHMKPRYGRNKNNNDIIIYYFHLDPRLCKEVKPGRKEGPHRAW